MLDPKSRRNYHREYEKARMQSKPFMQAQDVPEDMADKVLGIWMSQNYSAVAWAVHDRSDFICRLVINRRELEPDGSWKQGITWDDIQSIKHDCGYGDYDALEVYPRDVNLVFDAPMRHIWVVKEPLNFGLHIS